MTIRKLTFLLLSLSLVTSVTWADKPAKPDTKILVIVAVKTAEGLVDDYFVMPVRNHLWYEKEFEIVDDQSDDRFGEVIKHDHRVVLKDKCFVIYRESGSLLISAATTLDSINDTQITADRYKEEGKAILEIGCNDGNTEDLPTEHIKQSPFPEGEDSEFNNKDKIIKAHFKGYNKKFYCPGSETNTYTVKNTGGKSIIHGSNGATNIDVKALRENSFQNPSEVNKFLNAARDAIKKACMSEEGDSSLINRMKEGIRKCETKDGCEIEERKPVTGGMWRG